MGQYQNVPGPSQDEFNAQTQAIASINSKFTLTNETVTSLTVEAGKTNTITISNVPTGYIPIGAYLRSAGYAQVTASIPVYREADGLIVVRLYNNSAYDISINGTLYVLWYKNS